MERFLKVENVTSNGYDMNSTELPPLADDVVRVAVPLAFAIIFFVGLIGNGTLVYIVFKNKQMHTKPNVLIVSLAVGDFLLILFSVPFTSAYYVLHEWCLGTVVCKLDEFMQTVSLGVSVFTLVALSADRFLAIVYPFTAYCSVTMTKVRAVALSIWIVAVLMGLMDLVGSDVRPCCTSKINVCDPYPEEWGDRYKEFRKMFRFIVYFMVPVIVITTLYSLIAVVLLRKPQTGNQVNAGKDSISTSLFQRIEARKRVAKIVLSFVVIFVVCWLPRHVYVVWTLYVEPQFNEAWQVFKIVGFCLCFIYSSVNPFILYCMNEDFRLYFRSYLFGCCNPKWRRQPEVSRINSATNSAARYSAV